MADYVVVPKASGDTNVIMYAEGTQIGYCDSYPMRVSYYADMNYNIKCGVYGNSSQYMILWVPDTTAIGVKAKCLENNGSNIIALSEIAGQMITDGMSSNVIMGSHSFSFDITVFDTRDECYEALTAIPVVNPGVHVTFSPVYIPSFSGVHVQFNPVLSDSNAQGGTSVLGGGDGTFDETSDAIPVPSLPSISTVDTGLVTLFRPTAQELIGLSRYLWSHLGDLEINLQKLFTNPMDYFIAFNIFPVSPLVTNVRNIYIGNLTTDIYMSPVANQWYEFDCGTVTLQKYWGSALDYAPNTKVQLMLPYIGSVQLNTDEVMGQQIGVKYRIDLLSGSCVAMVTVNGNVYYQFTGECAVAVPLTGADWSRVYSAVIGAVGTAIAGGVGVAAAGMGITSGGMIAAKSYESAAAAGASYAAINETSKGVKGVAEMRQTMIEAARESMANAKGAASKSYHKARGFESMRLANTINNTVGQVMGAKSGVSHSGTVSGSAGMLGVRDAYLIIEYPNQSLAKDYKHFVGYPSNMYARLGTLSGYTEVEQVIPEGIWGTDDELAELIDALKGGVYL